MKDILEKVELAVHRTHKRAKGIVGEKLLIVLEMLGEELCRIAMEESGGTLEDE